MQLHSVDQGSDDWKKLRLGVPTASQFARVVQPTKLLPSASIKGYAYELAYERLFREEKNGHSSMYMERGKICEGMARDAFAERFGAVALGGFALTDDGTVGCSPDGFLTTEAAGLEIKCPSGPQHLEYLLEGPGADYRMQVQGSLLVTGLDRWYFMSYHQRMPGQNTDLPWQMKIIRFDRDEKVIDALRAALLDLGKAVDKICGELFELGFRPQEPVEDPGYGDIMRSDMNALDAILKTGNLGG